MLPVGGILTYTCLVPWQYVGDRLCGNSAIIRDFANP